MNRNNSSSKRNWSLLCVATIAYCFLAAYCVYFNRKLLFELPIYENSDFALNVLQVENAKSFSEWRGNYSRWGFHHPGPFYWYVFAGGEWLFYHVLGIVPTPGNAHVLAFTLLSLGFLTCAFFWLAKALGDSTWIPVIASAALPAAIGPWLHFSNHWPPFFPAAPLFLCASAAFALTRGHAGALPFMVLATFVAVHAHVAQPLFVFVIASYVLVIGWRSPLFRASLLNTRRTVLAVSAAIATILAFPLLFDAYLWASGRTSSLAQIAAHLQKTHNPPHSWLSALKYIHGFLDPNLVFGRSIHVATAVLCALVFGHNLIRAVSVFGVRRGVDQHFILDGRAEPDAAGCLAFLALLLLAATFLWAKIQDGPQYPFNSFFIYGVFLLNLLPVLWTLGFRIVRKWRVSLSFATAAMAIQGYADSHDTRARTADYDLVVARNRQVKIVIARYDAAAVEFVDRFVLLDIDRGGWELAAGLLAELKRRGICFGVMPEWEFQYGGENGYKALLTRAKKEAKDVQVVKLVACPDSVRQMETVDVLVKPAGVLPLDERNDMR